MPAVLRDKKPNRPGRAHDVARNLEALADALEHAFCAYDRQLREDLARWHADVRWVRSQPGVVLPGPVFPYERPDSDDPHERMPHRHDVLCAAPRWIVARERLMARVLREEFDKLGAENSSRAHFPCVNIRWDKARRHAERINVERSLVRLLHCARAERLTRWAKPEADWRLVALGLPGAHVLDPAESPDSTPRRIAVGRAITDLLDGLDTDAKKTIRRLGQVAFDGASALRAIAERLATLNPGAMALLRAEGAGDSSDPDRVYDLVAALFVGLNRVGGELLQLDDAIRSFCLTAPYDQALRGSRPEQTSFLRTIKHLDSGGFTERKIASIIDDGGSDDMRHRVRRVREHLDCMENGTFRDRRTRFIRGVPPSGAPTR